MKDKGRQRKKERKTERKAEREKEISWLHNSSNHNEANNLDLPYKITLHSARRWSNGIVGLEFRITKSACEYEHKCIPQL